MDKENLLAEDENSSQVVKRLLQELEITLKRGKYKNSSELATSTLQVVEKYVQSNLWKTAEEIISWLQDADKRLSKAADSESAPSNIIQRLIKTIQEDFCTRKLSGIPGELISQRSFDIDMSGMNFSEEIPELRSDIQNAIWDLYSELESSSINIAEDAEKHIHPNDVILTVGKSRTVEAFFKRAAKKRSFEVVVAEGAPFSRGKELAENLSKSKITTTLIEDTAVFSIMSRVDKVIIGTHTVLANGGLKCIAGAYPVALAAKYYNVPVFVLAALYKLSPEYPLSADVKIKNRYVSPEALVNYENQKKLGDVMIYVPTFDYVPPDLISLFIFNIGSHAPSYIYRLLHETYPQH